MNVLEIEEALEQVRICNMESVTATRRLQSSSFAARTNLVDIQGTRRPDLLTVRGLTIYAITTDVMFVSRLSVTSSFMLAWYMQTHAYVPVNVQMTGGRL